MSSIQVKSSQMRSAVFQYTVNRNDLFVLIKAVSAVKTTLGWSGKEFRMICQQCDRVIDKLEDDKRDILDLENALNSIMDIYEKYEGQIEDKIHAKKTLGEAMEEILAVIGGGVLPVPGVSPELMEQLREWMNNIAIGGGIQKITVPAGYPVPDLEDILGPWQFPNGIPWLPPNGPGGHLPTPIIIADPPYWPWTGVALGVANEAIQQEQQGSWWDPFDLHWFHGENGVTGEYGEADYSLGIGNFSGGFDSGFSFMNEDGFINTNIGLGIAASILSLSGNASAGSDLLGAGVEAEGKIGSGALGTEGEFSIGKEGVNAYVSGEAMVAAAEGEVKGTINILGFEITLSAEGYAGAIGGEAEFGIKDNKFVADIGAAFGFGGSVGFEIGLNDTGWNAVVDGVSAGWDYVTDGWNYMSDVVSDGWDIATDAVSAGWDFTTDAISTGWDYASDAVSTTWDFLSDLI